MSSAETDQADRNDQVDRNDQIGRNDRDVPTDRDDPIDRIVRDVRASGAVNGIRIVGIDGPSGAGKSTLAKQVAAALDAPLIQIDDFVSWSDFSGWWPRFDAQVLTPLVGRSPRALAGEGLGRVTNSESPSAFGEPSPGLRSS